ncbi:MAG: ATP-binding protein [Lachnospiraceae bacterium]|jgi:predicted ATPase|nr:ATP-binding protein [Lachnospiraceae bacterium]
MAAAIRKKNLAITSVYVGGFKNLSDVRIEFSPITALIALNNYGKSNVINAIDFGMSFLKSVPGDKDQMMANAGFMPMNTLLQGKNYRFEIKGMIPFNDKVCHVVYGYEFSWKNHINEDAEIVSEHLQIKQENSSRYTQLINREKGKALYRRSESGRCSSKILVKSDELIINKLDAFDEFYYSPIINRINKIDFYMETQLDVKNMYQPDPIIVKGLENMRIDAQNLPRVIYQLHQTYPDKFELLKDAYTELFPDVEDILIRRFNLNNESGTLPEDAPFSIANSIYALYVKNHNLNHPLNFSQMSDGAKRVFMILTRIILAELSNVSLIAIEEPENSVHPGLLKAYLQIIHQLQGNCRIIITSHSPYIISYLNPKWIYVGVGKKPGIAEFRSFRPNIEKTLLKDAKRFDMSMGDYLFSLISDADGDWNEYLECNADE